MKKTLIIGSVHVDLLSKVKQLPKGNEDFQIENTTQRVTSSAFTMAKLFRDFDFPCELMSPIGTGIYAEAVIEGMNKEKISTHCFVEEMNGCTYTLIDPDGETSEFIMPGAEYVFDRSFTEEIYPDEIGNVAVFGEMLTSDEESISDLLETLDDLRKPVFFIPNGRSQDISENVFSSLLQIKPTIYLTDTEAYYLADEYSGELRDVANHLYEKTDCKIMIMKQKEGCFVKEEKDIYFAPSDKKIDIDRHMALFSIAKQAGVDDKNALMFAFEYADALSFDQAKQRLASLILAG